MGTRVCTETTASFSLYPSCRHRERDDSRQKASSHLDVQACCCCCCCCGWRDVGLGHRIPDWPVGRSVGRTVDEAVRCGRSRSSLVRQPRATTLHTDGSRARRPGLYSRSIQPDRDTQTGKRQAVYIRTHIGLHATDHRLPHKTGCYCLQHSSLFNGGRSCVQSMTSG